MNQGRGVAAAALVVLAACEGANGPAIDRLEPAVAARGETVTVRGAGFCGPELAAESGECTSLPSGSVAFGLSPPMTRAPVLAWADGAISVQVPAVEPGPIAVIVTVDGRSSNAVTLEVKP